MGIYSRCLFPCLLDALLDTTEFGRYRRAALAQAAGATLEIGFGTGLNLPHYPARVTHLTALDATAMLRQRVTKRIALASFPVTQVELDAQGRLPFADQQFDTVVTTLTLCSIAQPALALAEMLRVIKPRGRFLFFEHGRSAEMQIAAQQDRWNWLQNIVGAGCHLNRPIDRIIAQAGFQLHELERFYLPHAPRATAAMYRGVAVPMADKGT